MALFGDFPNTYRGKPIEDSTVRPSVIPLSFPAQVERVRAPTVINNYYESCCCSDKCSKCEQRNRVVELERELYEMRVDLSDYVGFLQRKLEQYERLCEQSPEAISYDAMALAYRTALDEFAKRVVK